MTIINIFAVCSGHRTMLAIFAAALVTSQCPVFGLLWPNSEDVMVETKMSTIYDQHRTDSVMNKRKACCSDSSESKLKRCDDCKTFFVSKSPPLLKDITAARIAISLWYHEKLSVQRDFSHFFDYSDDSNRDPDYSEVFEADEESYIHRFRNIGLDRMLVEPESLRKRVGKSIQTIPIPEQLRNVVKNYPGIIESELTDWLCYHQQRILHLLIDANIINYIIELIVWSPDATIDYIATARNMLTSPYLKDIQKYRLACTYCFEYEIKNTSDAIVDKNAIGLTFRENPLEYYWSCYLKNEIRKINIGDAVSIDSYMLTRTRVSNWAAIEYFFDRLSSEEQVVKAKYLIRKYGIRFQTAVLSKLDDGQQNRVFMECATIIITNYAKIPSYKLYVLAIWLSYRKLVTPNDFSKMIDNLLAILHCSDTEADEIKMKYVESLLFNIWTNSSAQLRSNALNDEEYYIFDHFLFNDFIHPNIDRMKLIAVMLSDADETMRAQLFNESDFLRFSKDLVKSYDADFLDWFLKVCSSDTDQVTQFKKSVMNSSEIKLYCKDLIKKHDFDTLNTILACNLDDLKDIVNYKKQILKYICISELRADIYENMNEMIDNCLSDARKSLALKKEIILDTEIVDKFFQDINDDKFVQVKLIVEELFVDVNDLNDIRIKLLLTFKNILLNGTFSELRMYRWEEFLLWCLEDDVNIAKFKNSLPIDNIFKDLLLRSVFVSSHPGTFRNECNFENLNMLLDWYFDSKAKIKQFKISKIFISKEINVIDRIIENKKTEMLKQFLDWCFENDLLLINQFKTNYGHLAVIDYM